MKSQEISEHRQHLDYLFKRVASVSGDIEFQAYWAQYLCVLTSGFIENSVRNLYTRYAKVGSNAFVANYVSHELQSFQNAKAERILELTKLFNPEWEVALRNFMKDKRKDAIDSVVNLRHQIAHGRSVSVTFARIRDYYQSSVEVIDFIDGLLQ